MSHYFGVDGIKEKLITVSGLVLSGEEFCRRYKMGLEEYNKVYDINDYTSLTKLIVSNALIEIAVKVRCLVDGLRSQNLSVDFVGNLIFYNLDGKSEKTFAFFVIKLFTLKNST